MEEQTPNPQEVQALLVEKARLNPAFRRDLLAAPKAAVERVLGIALPPEIEIQVMEETPTKICLVLPMEAGSAATALPDSALAAVTGGVIGDIGQPKPPIGLVQIGLGRINLRGITPINLP